VLPAPLSPVQLRAVGGFVLVSALLLRVERYMHAGERITVIQVAFVVAAASAAVLSIGPAMLRYRPPVVAYVTLGVATVIGVITVVVVDDPMIDDTVIQVACAVLGGFASLHILGPAVLRYSAPVMAYVTLGLAAVTGVITVVVVDNPMIDVWHLLQQSSDGLLRGDNMYGQRWTGSNGLQDTYPYLPLTTVLLAPFRWLLGDVRYGLLLAALLTVVVAQRLGRARGAAVALVPLLIVLQPKWPFLIDQSWTEPMLLLFLAVAVLALDSGRPLVAVVAVGAALACKQHVVLLLPVLAMWPGFGWRRAIVSGVGAGVVVLPWFIWSPGLFWEDAVEANLGLGVIERALGLPSLLQRAGVTTSFVFLLLMLLAAYAVVWWRVPRTTAGLCIASALVLLTLDVANKQSFFNHYSLPLGVLVLALVAAGERNEHSQRHERVDRAG
jgi:hypothetical protein